ncbi:MAG: HlyD family secretion protein [Vicinamibacterales bacterium]
MAALVTAILTALVVGACEEAAPDTTLRVSGFVEATEVQVSGEVGGRIVELAVREGDRVMRGSLIARLDTRDVELQMARVRSERAAADAQLRLLQAGARPEDIRQASAQVEVAAAELTAVESEVRAATLDVERFEALLAAEAGSRKQRDDARARVDVAQGRQRAAAERVRAAREALARLEAGARAEEIEAARARVASTDAQMAVLDKAVADAEIVSPADGMVTATLVEAGERVAPRAPLVVVTDLARAWANLYVPEPMVPRIQLGQPATLLTDAEGQALQGEVSFISPTAEFTPRNVQTADERSKLVYRIKVSVDNSGGILKSGMPVDAELALQ